MPTDEVGQQNPLTHLASRAFDAMIAQCFFCMPGRIVAFDAETQLAQVECGIQRVVDGTPKTRAIIPNVPVHFAGDGQFYFWHQITPGETEGLIHFSQRAIDTWIDQGGPVAPHTRRVLAKEDAFFVPGVRSQPGKIPGFKNDGAGIGNYAGDTLVHLKASGDIAIEAPGAVTITAGGDATVDCDSAQVTAATGVTVDTPEAAFTGIVKCAGLQFTAKLPSGSYMETDSGTLELQDIGIQITNGDVVADGISLKNHTHTDSQGGTTSTAE